MYFDEQGPGAQLPRSPEHPGDGKRERVRPTNPAFISRNSEGTFAPRLQTTKTKA